MTRSCNCHDMQKQGNKPLNWNINVKTLKTLPILVINAAKTRQRMHRHFATYPVHVKDAMVLATGVHSTIVFFAMGSFAYLVGKYCMTLSAFNTWHQNILLLLCLVVLVSQGISSVCSSLINQQHQLTNSNHYKLTT